MSPSLIDMMIMDRLSSISLCLLVLSTASTLVAGQIDPQLVGTWTTKSAKVVTGPVSASIPPLYGIANLVQGFYNPIADKFIEPELTGISYSFTENGFYESAHYRAVPNRTSQQSIRL